MATMKTASKALILTSLLVLFASATTSAFAADPDTTKWEKDHPRRAEVNGRLAKQNARVKEQVKEGDMTRQEAATVHEEHHMIREEERAMAAQNNGHITKAQKRELNKQENAVSKQIGK